MSHSDSETLLERSYPAEPAQLCEIRSAVTELSRRQGLSERQAAEVALAISEAVANIGAANAFGLAVEGYQITVVGEVPTATVKRVGSGMRPAR